MEVKLLIIIIGGDLGQNPTISVLRNMSVINVKPFGDIGMEVFFFLFSNENVGTLLLNKTNS